MAEQEQKVDDQQLEEAAEIYGMHKSMFPISMTGNQINHCAEEVKKGFIAGAKWQSEQTASLQSQIDRYEKALKEIYRKTDQFDIIQIASNALKQD